MTETDTPRREHRRVADAPSLRALTHPTRIALIEAIGLAGTLTATQASEAVGESPTACAYHLRMLGRLGFLEEAGGGSGRERPWRLAQTGISFGEDADDPAAAQALENALAERFIARIRAFRVGRNRYPEDVQAVTGVNQSVVFATPEEFRELRAEIAGLPLRFARRLDPELRPPGSLPFEVVMFAHVMDVHSLDVHSPDVPGQGADDEKTLPDT